MRTPLKFEPLEAREVPAIVLAGLDGGPVTITEAAGVVNDQITLTQSGDELTVTSSDGIYVGDPAGGGLVPIGTSVAIRGATSIDVRLTEGGDDVVQDDTALAVFVDGGPGSDRIASSGGPGAGALLLSILQSPGGFDPALVPAAVAEAGRKVLTGGDGDDAIAGPLFGFFAHLDGGAGNDTVFSGFGPDVVAGGTGRDALFGAGGGDLYIANDWELDLVLGAPGAVQSDPLDVVVLVR